MREDGLSPGDLLAGRYRLIDRIGLGGMAVIWRAHDETLDRLVAVKVLDLSLSSDIRLRDLVRREAWAGARLNHPDVASVHDFVHLGAFGMLVMQLVEGEPLADLIAAGPLPWADAARIGARVAAVLDHAHHRGVVHRDVTPDNVVIHGDQVTVLDFGIAARIGEPDDDNTGASFGTPAYVAPERLDGTPAQTATDIYALGVILYEMLTGRVPFRVRGWEDVASAHGSPSPIGVHPRLEALVLRMLSRDTSMRPRASEIKAQLDAMVAPARSRIPAIAAGLVAVAVAALALWRPWHVTSPGAVPSVSPSPYPVVVTVPSVMPSPVPSAPASPTPSRPAPTVPVITAPPSSPSPSPVTKQQAVAAINSLIDDGMASGAIRDDAGLDLKQMVRNATEVSHLDSVRMKIDDREREGSVTSELAGDLRSAVDTLSTAMRA